MIPPRPRRHHAATAALAGWLALATLLMASAAPASAQYGGSPSLFVDPFEVPVDAAFDAVGFDCPGASVVTITIDGVPGTLATTIAEDDNSYGVTGVDMPDGLEPGARYTVRATCGDGTATFEILAVCSGGALPVDGSCGGTTAQVTTTTSIPTTAPTTTPATIPTTTVPTPGGEGEPADGGSGGGAGGGDDDGGTGGRPLAVTGASSVEQIAQVGVTLVALGGIVVLAATRRRDRADA